MDRSRVLTLIETAYSVDSIGQMLPSETRRDVFCNISSISLAEQLAAGQAGLKPECRATMFVHDYHGEGIVELDGVRYGIYRTYLGRNETIELYLERKAGIHEQDQGGRAGESAGG